WSSSARNSPVFALAISIPRSNGSKGSTSWTSHINACSPCKGFRRRHGTPPGDFGIPIASVRQSSTYEEIPSYRAYRPYYYPCCRHHYLFCPETQPPPEKGFRSQCRLRDGL